MSVSLDTVDRRRPIDFRHPLNAGLSAWWLTLPGWGGGSKWIDLCGQSPIALANFTAGHGWQPSTRPGGSLHLDWNATSAGTAVGTCNSPAINGWTSLTVSVWCKLPLAVPTEFTRIIEKGANNEWTLEVGNDLGSTAYGVQVGGATVVASSHAGVAYNDNTWHHLLFTISSSFATLFYVDGVLSPNGTGTGAAGITNGQLNVGQYSGSSGLGLVGQTDDLRIHKNRVYSAADVWNYYNLSRRGYPGLLNRWTPPRLGAVSGGGGTPITTLRLIERNRMQQHTFRRLNSTTTPLFFDMVLASDHVTPATGLSPTVQLLKPGGAFASPAGTVSELGNGRYQVGGAGLATDLNSYGLLTLSATAATADPVKVEFNVSS